MWRGVTLSFFCTFHGDMVTSPLTVTQNALHIIGGVTASAYHRSSLSLIPTRTVYADGKTRRNVSPFYDILENINKLKLV